MTTAAPKVSAVSSTPAMTATLQAGTGTVLTVGAGMEFSSLSDALKASVAGDTIAVKAGTYTNDFGVVSQAVKIVAVGGIVNEVATVPPPNDKALLTVDANLSIQGFTFTGGSDGSPDGNVAGIRVEAGNLNVGYCYFHDMQEGLLVGNIAGTVVNVDHSEFSHNGTGDGYTHNFYAGAIASLTITNSYFHDAVVGHEIKSRAAVTTITNNVIADGATGTASYDIDLPNAGFATITGNTIEKGPMASNRPVIHYGGETQFAWTNNSLEISGNTVINDYGADANLLLNQANVNGLSTSGIISNNTLWGFNPAAITIGAATLTNNTVPVARPSFAAPATWSAVPKVAIAAGNQLLNLVNSGHVIGGGTNHLTLNDPIGSNTVNGGVGGLTMVASGGFDQISTAAGATDTITLSGRNGVLHAAGNDHIAATGTYEDVFATGAATITSAGFNTIDLGGANEQLTETNDGNVKVEAAADAHLTDNGGDLGLTVAGGAHFTIIDQAPSPSQNPISTATVTGALTGGLSKWGSITLNAGDTGVTVQAGTGQVSVAGGAGADSLTAGSGSAAFSLGGGGDNVVFGSGNATVVGGTGVDTYHFHAGSDGQDVIDGFKQGTDVLSFEGFTGNAIASGTVAGGNTTLTLTDGTTILFGGVTLPGYAAPAPTPAPTPAPAPAPSPSPTPNPGTNNAPSSPINGSGSLVLTQTHQSVAGGATALNVTDQAGNNTIAGGSGGLTAAAGCGDLITTASGSTNTLILSRDDTVTSAGTDQVTCTSTGDVVQVQGAATVVLQNTGASVTGGAGLLDVTGTSGGATLCGGTGGLVASLTGGYDVVTTSAGAADTVGVNGYSTVMGAGTDHVSVQGLYNQITETGAATISSASLFSGYDLEGADSLTAAGGLVTVGGAASASVTSACINDISIIKQAGGSLHAAEVVAHVGTSLDLTGGAATVFAGAGTYARLAATTYGGVNVIAGSGTASVTSQAASGAAVDTIHGGSGDLTVTSGARGVDLMAGSGNATLVGGAGSDTVSVGSGTVVVLGGSGAEHFLLPAAGAGTLVVLNWSAQDTLVTSSGTQPDITAQSVSGGSTWLTTSTGAHVDLLGVTTHFGGM